MIPNEKSYCEIDPNVVDRWGIPVLRFHWQWSENELNMAKDMRETFRSIIETAGGTVLNPSLSKIETVGTTVPTPTGVQQKSRHLGGRRNHS